MAAGRGKRILEIIATDKTFVQVELRGELAWEGRCIFCRTRLWIRLDGEPISRATIEHIVPRSKGGTDELSNLALACSTCNHEKGRRHDRRDNARAQQVQADLLARRLERWRTPGDE